MPWQTWSWGGNLDATPLSHEALIRGDDYARAGFWHKALKEYLAQNPRQLTVDERRLLTLRIASTYLALDQSAAALKIGSDYFKSQKLNVDSVDFGYSLFFAYGYGRDGNYDQSLAWFSRARRQAGSDRSGAAAAEQGLRMLLSSVPAERFDELDRNWAGDGFINVALGRERARRSAGRAGTAVASGKFWEWGGSEVGSTYSSVSLPAATGEQVTIGVVMPLTGRFAAFGNSIKNGIELALDTMRTAGEAPYRLVFKDSAVGVDGARAGAMELINAERAAFILGPLLSEESVSVGDLARQSRVPVLTFSKSAAFNTGDGVFRLGPTIESQIDSLMEECFYRLGLRKYGVIFAEDENGREFEAAFRRKLQSLGLQPTSVWSYVKSDSGAMLRITSEVEIQPELEAVFFPDNLETASRFYGGLSQRARERIRLLGTASWDNPAEISQSRSALNGSIFVSPFFTLSAKPMVSQFVSSYNARYKRAPDFLAAQGFDAATMVLAAIERQRKEGIPFMQAFHSIERYEGLTGNIYVDPGGELRRRFSVVQLLGDSLVEPPELGAPRFGSFAQPGSTNGVYESKERQG